MHLNATMFYYSFLEEKDGEKVMEGLLETVFPDPGQIRNHTVHVSETDDDYERLVSDVWVGIVLILMILSCIGCVCSCLLYHKFQQWKHHSSGASRDSSPELGDGPRRPSNESLPSYTLVTGLPTYEQALEQAKLGVCLRPPQSLVSSMMAPPPPASPGPKMPPPPFHEVKS
ncbi:protein commissureless 2 homolog isoform X2 [Rhodnius prolixus]|uniref:protein commissureless 2 homolog isoform X2 n=1 Tax=Rhodnius prolixus TaxID=13249 RepID=UPI003D189102